MPRTICYLNTDLDLVSPQDLRPLLTALGAGGVDALYPTERAADGLWRATLETATSGISAEPEADLAVMLAAIDAFPPAVRAAWDGCTLREFNLGYDCGDRPWAFNNGLSNGTLRRIAAAGATLRITLYPAMGEDDEDEDEDEDGVAVEDER
jgi:hypothetical protein